MALTMSCGRVNFSKSSVGEEASSMEIENEAVGVVNNGFSPSCAWPWASHLISQPPHLWVWGSEATHPPHGPFAE